MRRILLGRLDYWLLWVVIMVALYLMDRVHLHVRDFSIFILLVLSLSAGCVAYILLTYRPGERITREPFEET